MIIKLILITGFLVFVFKLLANPNSSQLKALGKLFALGLTCIAIAFVLLPDSLNVIAKAVGVTRGADLVLYLLALSFIFATFNQYLRSKQMNNQLVALGRKIALIEAEARYNRFRKP